MHSTARNCLLMIEPRGPASDELVRDWATKKMTRLLMSAQKGNPMFGWHECVCGQHSDNFEWLLPFEIVTNNLAVHYLSRHRAEVPICELEKLAAMPEPGKGSELRWHYGPTEKDSDPGKMWCYACGGEVNWIKSGPPAQSGDGAYICLRCGKHSED